MGKAQRGKRAVRLDRSASNRARSLLVFEDAQRVALEALAARDRALLAARSAGVPWSSLAEVLDVSAQAVQQRAARISRGGAESPA